MDATAFEEAFHSDKNHSHVSIYLKELRETYDAKIETESEIFHIVIGNEAADLDSISAAIARAKNLSLESSKVFFPVVNIPREDLSLRRDAEYLFDLLNVDIDSLLFVDEIPLDVLAGENRLQIHLVDHNALAVHQEHLQDQVFSIVDHHVDEQVDYPKCPEKNKTVKTVGSATSLVAKNLLNHADFVCDSSWAYLLLAPILLDTENLQSASKTTPLDQEVAQDIVNLVKDDAVDDFFTNLYKARIDIEGFTLDMLLRKDLKRYQEGKLTYTISSLPNGVTLRWGQDNDLLAILQNFRKKQAIPIMMILELAGKDCDTFRRLHIHCESQQLLRQLIHHFEVTETLVEIAQLERIDMDAATATWLLPISVSRKVLQPKLGLYTATDSIYRSDFGICCLGQRKFYGIPK